MPAAVFSGGDVACEVGVVDRVVLGLHGEPILITVERQVLGHRPRHEHTAPFEPEVVVQAAGVVLLDHEDGPGGLLVFGSAVAERLRRLSLVALAPVLAEVDHRRRCRGTAGRGLRGLVWVCCGLAVAGFCVESDQQVAELFEPVRHLVERNVPDVLVGQLIPVPGGGDPGFLAATHRVGRQRGLGRAVLAPVHEHLAAAHRFCHLGSHQIGGLVLQLGADLPGDLACGIRRDGLVEPEIDVDSLGAAGHREARQPDAVEHLLDAQRHLRALEQRDVRPGVEIEDHSIGHAIDFVRDVGLARRQRPLRHVQLQRGLLCEPDQLGARGQHRVDHLAVAVVQTDPAEPFRSVVGQVLLEERGRVHTVRPPLAGHRPVTDVRQHHRADVAVVLDDLRLDGPGCRVDHLVEVGHGDLVTVDLECVAAGHGSDFPGGGGCVLCEIPAQ